ncbi:MAG: histidine kinase, partial [Bacteroidota bacterium]
FRLDDRNLYRNIVIHFAIGICIAVVQQSVYVVITDFVESGFTLSRTFSGYLPSIIGFFEYGVLMYWSIVFIHHAVGYYRRYQQEERQSAQLRSELMESQLQALKMQLQPHFLFNTLNAISVLVKKEPALAQKMISRLSDLLRLTLERGTENEVTLVQELEFVNTYLAIEKVRFGERLRVKFDIAESTLQASVPTFIFQPLVENSIRHGIAQRSGEGWITVQSVHSGTELILNVNDGGSKVKRTKKVGNSLGVGLENTQQRLLQLYGNKSQLDVRENEHNGYSVSIRIPFSRMSTSELQ